MLGTYNAFKDLFDFKLIKGTPHIAFSLHSLSLGYPQDSLEAFVNKYRSVERVYVYYSFYSKGIKILSIIMFSIQIISWFVISYKISTFIFVYNTIPAILTIGSRQIPKIINKPYSTQAHAVHKFAEPFLEKKNTGNAFARNHLIAADPEKVNPQDSSEILVEGTYTKGDGTVQNPSHEINNTTLVNGEDGVQKFIAYPPNTFAPFFLLYRTPVPGSKKYMEQNAAATKNTNSNNDSNTPIE